MLRLLRGGCWAARRWLRRLVGGRRRGGGSGGVVSRSGSGSGGLKRGAGEGGEVGKEIVVSVMVRRIDLEGRAEMVSILAVSVLRGCVGPDRGAADVMVLPAVDTHLERAVGR